MSAASGAIAPESVSGRPKTEHSGTATPERDGVSLGSGQLQRSRARAQGCGAGEQNRARDRPGAAEDQHRAAVGSVDRPVPQQRGGERDGVRNVG